MKREVLSHIIKRAGSKLHKGCIYHKAHSGAHGFYFGAVAWEAHGMYAGAAAVLLVLTVFGWLAKLE